MKNLMNRVNYVLNGEDGASNVEIIVWFSVVFVIATLLFVFKDTVSDFIKDTNTRISKLALEEKSTVAGQAPPSTGTGRT